MFTFNWGGDPNTQVKFFSCGNEMPKQGDVIEVGPSQNRQLAIVTKTKAISRYRPSKCAPLGYLVCIEFELN